MTVENFYRRCHNCYSSSKFIVFKGLQEVYYGKYKDMSADIKCLSVGTFIVKGSDVIINCEVC